MENIKGEPSLDKKVREGLCLITFNLTQTMGSNSCRES